MKRTTKYVNADTQHDAAAMRTLDRLQNAAVRDWAKVYIRVRRNSGIASRSGNHYANTLAHVDTFLQGRAFWDATPLDWVNFIEHLRASMKPSSVFSITAMLRRMMKDYLGIDGDDKLPKHLNKTLYFPEPSPAQVGQVIGVDWFNLLLDDVGTKSTARNKPLRVLEWQAILWLLWDSGMRISEMLGLHVGDIAFDGKGSAVCRMRNDQLGLKTGPRTVAICESVGPLQAWFAVHPATLNGMAPLFPGAQSRDGLTSINLTQVWVYLQSACDRIGWTKQSPLGALSAHDFRHTCATRKARAGWKEPKLRVHFGWANDSPMPAHYVHLAEDDLVSQVRRDAGLDGAGFKEGMDVKSEFELWQRLNRKFMLDDLGQSIKTVRTPEWEQR